MNKLIKNGFHLSLAVVLGLLIFCGSATVTYAQEQSPPAQSANQEIAGAQNSESFTTGDVKATPVVAPLWSDYKGVRIGMNADEVRKTLDHLKDKGDHQDFFVFSEMESAQVFYDDQGAVKAVSVTYVGGQNAPQPATVVGEEIQAKDDGSMYRMARYPEAGYWVSYSRTAGDSPIITVTMQKIR